MVLDTKEYAFNQFKLLLGAFIENNFKVCSNFLSDVRNSKTEDEICKLFRRYSDDVYTELGGEVQDEDKIDSLEAQIRVLENEVYDANNEAKWANERFGDSLNAEYKLKILDEYQEQYPPWELEELLKKRKTTIKEMKIICLNV